MSYQLIKPSIHQSILLIFLGCMCRRCTSIFKKKFFLKDKLIICDWQSEDYSPGGPAEVLRTALLAWDRGRSYARPPALLRGGFEQFRLAHPHLVTDPKVRAPSAGSQQNGPGLARAVMLPPSLDGIEYPDLDMVSGCF